MTDQPVPDKQLLWDTMQFCKQHPENHDQKRWLEKSGCGTIGCFAGNTCMLKGAEILDWGQTERLGGPLVTHPDLPHPMTVKKAATWFLGLTIEEANDLFWQFNTIEGLERRVRLLVGD